MIVEVARYYAISHFTARKTEFVAQTKVLEYLQKTAMNIMFSGDIDYTTLSDHYLL